MKTNRFIRFLLWLGFVKWGRKSSLCDIDESGQLHYRYPVQIIWPFHGTTWSVFKLHLIHGEPFTRFYVFRNVPGIVKWLPGRVLPRRWGVGFCGLEFGDRG